MNSIYSVVAFACLIAAASEAASAQLPDSGDKPPDTIPVRVEEPADRIGGRGRLSYNYVELSYAHFDLDRTSIGADGYGIGGVFLLAPNVFISAGYGVVETDQFDDLGPPSSIESTGFGLSLGYRQPLSDLMDFIVALGMLEQELQGKGGLAGEQDEDTGFQFGVGLRALITPQIELAGSNTYIEIFDDHDSVLSVSALFHATRLLSLSLDLGSSDDSTSYGIGARLNF